MLPEELKEFEGKMLSVFLDDKKIKPFFAVLTKIEGNKAVFTSYYRSEVNIDTINRVEEVPQFKELDLLKYWKNKQMEKLNETG